MIPTSQRPTITMGETPVPDKVVPRFDVWADEVWTGYAGESQDGTWHALIYADPSKASMPLDQTRYGHEGIFWLEAATRNLLLRQVARRLDRYRRLQWGPGAAGRSTRPK